jgi:hypothetical protein
MGRRLNEAGDALELYDFADRWIERYHRAWAGNREPSEHHALASDLREAVAALRAGADPRAPWGWKQPRSIYFLPLLHETFPELRFVHVIRDGRDIAFGPQSDGVLERAELALEPSPRPDLPAPLRLMELWTRVNLLAADYGEARLASGYLRVRLEDLCRTPRREIARLCAFEGSGADPARVRELSGLINPSASLGRWRHVGGAAAKAASEVGGPGLTRFGYDYPTRPRPGYRLRRLLRTSS